MFDFLLECLSVGLFASSLHSPIVVANLVIVAKSSSRSEVLYSYQSLVVRAKSRSPSRA